MNTKEEKVLKKAYCVCLTCGNTTRPYGEMMGEDNNLLPGTGICPKCSNTAYVMSLNGVWDFMEAVAKEIAGIKGDIFDLQVAEEERDGEFYD